MTLSIKNFALALAATFVLAGAAQAQVTQSSSWSSSWSASSGSSWGTRADGTTFRNGFNNSSSQSRASTTTGVNTPFGFRSNTTTLNQRQSSNNGFSQVDGPGGFRRNSFNDNSGSLSLTNQRRGSGPFGNFNDTRSLNAQFNNSNTRSSGFGPSGVFDNQVQRNSGSLTLGRNFAGNSVFGPSVRRGSTRTVGFNSERGSSRGFNSSGFFNDRFNSQNVTLGGSDFRRSFP